MRKDKEEILDQGAELIRGELENQAGEMISLRGQIDLKNVDLLSDNILINRNVHSTVKQQVRDFSNNIKKIIAATAFFIEEEGFISLDQAVAGLELQSKRDLTRLSALVAAQKGIKLSYGTLSAVVEIFKRVNVSLLRDMATSQDGIHTSSVSDARRNKTSLLLKNAILVYELTGFTISFLEKFRLEGMDDLECIKEEVFSDIAENRKSDEKLRAMVDRQKDIDLKDRTRKSIDDREFFRTTVEDKWNSILTSLHDQDGRFRDSLSIIERLRITQMDAKNTMDILNIAATTMLVSDSVEAINALASGVNGWELPELNERLVYELLNIDVVF